jgi:hypothetical protein
VINLSLQAFLFANSKEALQAAIGAVEASTSENVETALQLELNLEFFSASANPVSGTSPTTETSQTRPKDQNTSKRAKKGKSTKTTPSPDKTQTEAVDGWGGITPLRKLHNLAVKLRSSVLLFQSWQSAIGVALGIDNATRWNSWYKVIDTLLKKRPAIVIWLMENIDSVGDNHLEKDDWDLLQKTHEFLKAFNQATLVTEGGFSTLSDAMMTLDILLIHCRKTRVSKIISLLGHISLMADRLRMPVMPECAMLSTWLFLFSISTIAALKPYRYMLRPFF